MVGMMVKCMVFAAQEEEWERAKKEPRHWTLQPDRKEGSERLRRRERGRVLCSAGGLGVVSLAPDSDDYYVEE